MIYESEPFMTLSCWACSSKDQQRRLHEGLLTRQELWQLVCQSIRSVSAMLKSRKWYQFNLKYIDKKRLEHLSLLQSIILIQNGNSNT